MLFRSLLHWGLGASTQAEETSEVGISMGRTLHHRGGDSRRGVRPEEPEDRQERVEPLVRRVAAAFLRLEISYVSQ